MNKPALVPPRTIRRLSGFGMFGHSDGYVFQPKSPMEILGVFELARRSGHQVTLRAAGRSYGDAATGAECLVVDLSQMNRLLSWDPVTGIVETEPGVTLEELWRKTLPDGWWVPVVSGTMRTSLGGALAMNIHGKNNFKSGPLGEHVLQLDLLLPNGETRTLSPDDELFYAVVSGAGLIGVITRITLQMKRVTSGNLKVTGVSCRNWDEQFAAFERFEGEAEYVVSWIDCFASGESAGRGILHAGWHEPEDRPETLQASHQDLPAKIMGFFPKSQVWRILALFNNRFGMRLVNTLKHLSDKREHEKTHSQSFAKYNFLLDYVPGWERAYAPGGLIQCQFFIPRAEAKIVFRRLIEMQQAAKLESFLAVMKRHRLDKFLFSHAVDGYSLALDFKVTGKNRERLFRLADEMYELALEHGGRFYFAKDSALAAAQARRYLGLALDRFKDLKALYDPEGLLTSDLAMRLDLG